MTHSGHGGELAFQPLSENSANCTLQAVFAWQLNPFLATHFTVHSRGETVSGLGRCSVKPLAPRPNPASPSVPG